MKNVIQYDFFENIHDKKNNGILLENKKSKLHQNKINNTIAYYKKKYNLTGDIKNYASVYLCNEKTGRGNDVFIMSIDDAKKFCNDDRTKGVYLGNKWIYMFTSLEYLLNDCDSEINFKMDNGSQQKVIEELNIKIYN